MIRPIDDMRRRLDGARHDSDVALFYDLIGFGELLTKLVTLALVAAVEDDSHRQRYRLEYELARADGIGAWGAALHGLVTGDIRSALREEASAEVTDLTSRHQPDSEAWQARAVAALQLGGAEMDAAMPDVRGKVYAWMWFARFPTLRNRTRGHGAPRPAACRRACPPLEESLTLITDNLTLFSRPWAVVHRHLSGRSRVAPLNEVSADPDSQFELAPHARDGVYILFDRPRRVPLVECESDLSDFRVPNGAFVEKTGRFELLSYVRDERRTADGAEYLTPPARLPASETQGRSSMRQMGQTRSNLPPPSTEYVRRPELETELTAVLVNDRHPVVTLLGAGGVGKTSLALRVLEDLGENDRYGSVIWFSARDVDLLETGPKTVAPHVRTPTEMASEFARLVLSDDDASGEASELLSDALTNGVDGKPVLFAFDNFETVRDPSQLYRWLDTFVRNPNCVLITTRQRAFKGDFPIEVPGMSRSEFFSLVDTVGRALGIPAMLGDSRKAELFREADGHPYVAKVLLGEMARTRRARIDRIIASRDDILDALFERTFTALPATAQRVFLTLCAATETSVPQLALEAVMLRPQNDRVDVMSAVELLQQSSLIEVLFDGEADEDFLRVPAAASVFGQKKFGVSAARTQVLRDLHFLRHFAPGEGGTGDNELERRVTGFFEHVVTTLQSPGSELDDFTPIFEYLARRHAFIWLLLARLLQEFRPGWVGLDRAADAVRNFLEHQAVDSDAWMWLSELSADNGDYVGGINALIERAAIAGANYADISYAGGRLNEYFANHLLDELSAEEQSALSERLLRMLEPRAKEANATDCATIAWLLIKGQQRFRARYYVTRGLEMDPANPHCLRLREIVGLQEAQQRPGSGTPGAKRQSRDKSAYLAAVRQAIEEYAASPKQAGKLQSQGLTLASVGNEIRRRDIVRPSEVAFKNFQALVDAALEGSDLCVVRPSGVDHAHPRIAERGALPSGVVVIATGVVTPSTSPTEASVAPESGAPGAVGVQLTDPRLQRQLRSFSPVAGLDDAVAAGEHAARALACALEHPELRVLATREGVSLATLASAVRYAVPDLRLAAFGYRNLQRFLLDALRGSTLAIAVREGQMPPDPRVVFADGIPPGMRVLHPHDDAKRRQSKPA